MKASSVATPIQLTSRIVEGSCGCSAAAFDAEASGLGAGLPLLSLSRCKLPAVADSIILLATFGDKLQQA